MAEYHDENKEKKEKDCEEKSTTIPSMFTLNAFLNTVKSQPT